MKVYLEEGARENFKKIEWRKRIVILVLFFAVLIAAFFSVFVGSAGLSFSESWAGLLRQGNNLQNRIVWNIRMPRILAAIVAGFGLSVAGTVMQATLQNPMASPSTLGVSNAAVFGANLGIIVFGSGTITMQGPLLTAVNNPYLVSIFAFFFALISVLLVLALSKFRHFSSETVVLAGIAFGTLFTAGTTLVQYFAVDESLASAVFWTFGDLSRASYQETAVLAGVVFASFFIFMLFRFSYNALLSGDEVAKSLGVHVEIIRFISLLLASVICALTISILGIIGFLGIMGPHIMKRIVGNDHRYLLPSSALMGSLILILSDMVARAALNGTSLPVGAITSLLGAPIFLWIVFARKGEKPLCSR